MSRGVARGSQTVNHGHFFCLFLVSTLGPKMIPLLFTTTIGPDQARRRWGHIQSDPTIREQRDYRKTSLADGIYRVYFRVCTAEGCQLVVTNPPGGLRLALGVFRLSGSNEIKLFYFVVFRLN